MKKFYCFSVLFLILSLILSSCTGVTDGIDEELAPIESIDILVLESFPVQINVLINGYLPNPCYQITRIEKNQEGNTFYIKVFMKYNGLICIQTIKPYKETVALDVYGLVAGTYQVDVNGVVGSFTLNTDNILTDIEE
ncbi:MAG: hypothetical protein WAW45_02580 [Atribacterota bacterium]|nr:hypothetical protein [Atribacterota bacterium]